MVIQYINNQLPDGHLMQLKSIATIVMNVGLFSKEQRGWQLLRSVNDDGLR